jgi:hypothetical protein
MEDLKPRHLLPRIKRRNYHGTRLPLPGDARPSPAMSALIQGSRGPGALPRAPLSYRVSWAFGVTPGRTIPLLAC